MRYSKELKERAKLNDLTLYMVDLPEITVQSAAPKKYLRPLAKEVYKLINWPDYEQMERAGFDPIEMGC